MHNVISMSGDVHEFEALDRMDDWKEQNGYY